MTRHSIVSVITLDEEPWPGNTSVVGSSLAASVFIISIRICPGDDKMAPEEAPGPGICVTFALTYLHPDQPCK